MDEVEILEELNHNTRWLSEEYKNSHYYVAYLKQLVEDLSKTYIK